MNKDIGPGEEPHQRLQPGRRLQVENDRPLVAVVVEKGRREPRPPFAAGASGVAAVRGLDFDDVGPLVAEDHRAERPGHVRCQIDDPIAVQRSWHDLAFLMRQVAGFAGNDA